MKADKVSQGAKHSRGARTPASSRMAQAPTASATSQAQRAVEGAASDHAGMRRRQILDAAEECFRRRGFHNASMSEIAKTFGMSAGHIYNYFDSKESIIAAIVERDLEEFMRAAEELQGAVDMQRALLERVDAGVVARLNPSKSARQFEVLAEAGRNPEVLAMVQSADAKARRVLRDLFRRAQPVSSGGRELDGKVAVLMALFDGLMIRGLRQPDLNRTQVTKVLRSVIGEMMR